MAATAKIGYTPCVHSTYAEGNIATSAPGQISRQRPVRSRIHSAIPVSSTPSAIAGRRIPAAVRGSQRTTGAIQ